ncbi:MAG: cytochrome [Gammaproteobacteria bacterium]|nr:cytochrome [Gammaproteobacteria bacterium]
MSRLLHWSMAVMIIAMLFIGVGMASSVSPRYPFLLSVHRPLGIAILILATVRLVNRLTNPPPPLPDTIPPLQRAAAIGSHYVLYALMFGLPLVGWAMLSAAPYPVVLYGSLHLPSILSPNTVLHAFLRRLHTYLAYVLFATFVVHFAASLLHRWIRRDGVFESMAFWRKSERPSIKGSAPPLP